MRRRTVLGLDLSLTSPGMVWVRGKRAEGSKVLHWRNPGTTLADGSDQKRIRHIRAELSKGIDQHEPGLTLIEQYAWSKRTEQTRLGELGGVIREWLTANGIPWSDEVTSNSLKMYGTGNGNAGKPLMLSCARDIWSECPNHDVADAFHLARYGLDMDWELIKTE